MPFPKPYSRCYIIADKMRHGISDFVPTKQLAEDLNIAAPSAVKILQSLGGAGIIETREGAKGGVRLAIPPSNIRALDVFNALGKGTPAISL